MDEQKRNYSPSLLSLPRELRDRIWDFALEGTEIHVLKNKHVITVAYPESSQPVSSATKPPTWTDTKTWPLHTRPRWFLTCKQLLSEGLSQFAQAGICTRIATHYSCWSSTSAALAITRDDLLIRRIRKLRFHLPLAQTSNRLDASIGGANLSLAVMGGPGRHDEALLPADAKVKAWEFFPALESLELRLDVRGLELCARPKLMCIGATELRTLGTGFKRVHVSVPRLKLSVAMGAGEGAPPYIAPLFNMYPRLQRALVQLCGHMCRRLGVLAPPKPGEQWPSKEYRESTYWWVSEHTMHPCGEYESEGREEENWFKIGDWMDDENGEWHLEVEEMLGKRTDGKDEEGIVLKHTGLRYWSVPVSGQGSAGQRNFSRDKVARFGEKSWHCEDTGEVVWVEDREEAVTGYLQEDEQGQQQKRFLQEPPQPLPTPPYEPRVISCGFGRPPRN